LAIEELARVAAVGTALALWKDKSKPIEKRCPMLWTIFVILLVLWLLGIVGQYTLGGFIHVLLVIAVIVLLYNLFAGGRRAL
jgi:hypothetical protein